MMCQICNKRVATVCIATSINGVKNEQYLCAECAKAKGLNPVASSVPIFNLIHGLASGEASDAISDITCSSCGMTYKEFLEGSHLGCGKCYENFSEVITPLIKLIQGSAQHKGEVENAVEDAMQTSRKIQKLLLLLEGCINEEDYEQAAQLRDKIAVLVAQQEAENGLDR